MGGQLTNKTDEVLLIYGTKTELSPPEFDNGGKFIKKGKSTISVFGSNWDCDGFYVPADRKLKQLVGEVIEGPVAVKFPNGVHVTVTQSGAVYEVNRPNVGVFKPSEFCRPSNYPTCVNWWIPNLIYSEIWEDAND